MQIELDPHPEAPRSAQEPQANPYVAPRAAVADPAGSEDQVVAVAGAQRNLLLSVLASLIGNGVLRSGGLEPLVMLPLMVVIAAYSIWAVYKLCKALARNPILWIVAMFIPVINLIALIVLNSQATRFLKDRGIAVGFMGAKL